MKPRLVETTFNDGLGRALRAARHDWSKSPNSVLVEMTNVLSEGNSLQPDLLICGKNLQPIIIECSFSARDADKDAQERLGCHYLQGGQPILTTIALHVDKHFRESINSENIKVEILHGAQIRYALHQLLDSNSPKHRRRWPRTGFLSGSIFDLVHFLTNEAVPKHILETIAKSVALKIRQAASKFQDSVDPSVIDELKNVLHQRTNLTALHTTMVLWLNAIIVQIQLQRDGNPVTRKLSVMDSLPIKPFQIQEAWKTILETNWYSVFQPAVSVLSPYIQRDLQATSEALSLLIEAAEEIEISRVGSQLNVGAELFPELADDRKESAAFYTQPPTAELLSSLTIRESDLQPEQWADDKVLRSHCIADFACGTGTLLRAGYRRVLSYHERTSSINDATLDEFHRNAVEHGLIGADISPIAAHLSTASLAIMNLKQKYSKTRVGWLVVGGPKAMTGSLEYLESDHVTDLFDEMGSISVGNREAANAKELSIADESVDWILMNPPYSRTRGGQAAFDVAGMNQSTRDECQKRWKKLIKNLPAVKTAGMAASFLVLAKKKVKPGGRIGFVLPQTAAFASTWKKTRAMLVQEFEDIIAVAVVGGRALGKQALSADTDMEEMLLIATRKSQETEAQDSVSLHFVTLYHAVGSVGESAEIAKSILHAQALVQEDGEWYPIKVGEDEIGHISLDTLSSDVEPWSQLGTLNPYFTAATTHLRKGVLAWKSRHVPLQLPMTTLQNLFQVGPTHDLIGYPVGGDPRGAFEIHKMFEHDSLVAPDLSLWSANSKTQCQLLVQPTHKAISRLAKKSTEAEQSMRTFQSTLLYARNMRWTSQRVLAATTVRPVIGGSSWTTLQHENEKVYPVFSLWANSTLGMIVHWTQGGRTHTGRSRTQLDSLKAIPCPDFNRLNQRQFLTAKKHYQVLRQQELLPARRAYEDSVRIEIDTAIVDVLELPSDTSELINELRYLWCCEPSVHGSTSSPTFAGDQH